MNPAIPKEAFHSANWKHGFTPKRKPVSYSVFNKFGVPLAINTTYAVCVAERKKTNNLKAQIIPNF